MLRIRTQQRTLFSLPCLMAASWSSRISLHTSLISHICPHATGPVIYISFLQTSWPLCVIAWNKKKMVKCVLPVATKLYLIGLHCACQFSVHFRLISRIPGMRLTSWLIKLQICMMHVWVAKATTFDGIIFSLGQSWVDKLASYSKQCHERNCCTRQPP